MSADPTPRPKLRPPGERLTAATRRDARPAVAAPADDRGGRPPGRAVPVRWVLCVGVVVLLALALARPGGVTAGLAVPLALTLPGAILQPRYLPGLGTDVLTRWWLRVALSLATWALTALAVGAAGVPVRSGWPVVVAVVVLAAVLVGEPAGERRFGWLPARTVLWGVVGLVAAVALAFGGRALVALAGGTAGPTGGTATTLAFVDPTTPFALAATGAAATARVVVTNPGTSTLDLEVGGAVGRGLPWSTVTVVLPAGVTRVVSVSGVVPVCSDPQQAVVTVTGGGDVPPLAAVVPGADGAPRCPG